MKKKILTFLVVLTSTGGWCQNAGRDLPGELLNRLDSIRSADYFYYQTATLPYDTVPSLSYSAFKKEVVNRQDEFVGASVASFFINDTSRLEYYYDGTSKAWLDWADKTIPADSFAHNAQPFRIVYPPFITYVKSLLKYALETTDSISVSAIERPDSIIIDLFVHLKMPEVVGNRIVYAEITDVAPEEAFVSYRICLDRKARLPSKIVKRLPDKICWESCSYIRVNEAVPEKLDVKRYFPADFRIVTRHDKKKENMLSGHAALGWTLEDISHNLVSLHDLESRIILMYFTGLGCGPCQSAIPTLAKISRAYGGDTLEVVAIETWSNNREAVKKHMLNHNIPYQYLFATDKVRLDYQVSAVPEFVIMDQRRVIRRVITGFNSAITPAAIEAVIRQILDD